MVRRQRSNREESVSIPLAQVGVGGKVTLEIKFEGRETGGARGGV